MKILAIETSCDETALSIIKANNELDNFKVLSDLVISQIDIHAEYGGVFPALAKREHKKNLPLLLKQALEESHLDELEYINKKQEKDLEKILEREPELFTDLVSFFKENKIPKIDTVMVTHGPGLAPALWVGVNFAKAIAYLCGSKIIPVNHMEGHITSILLKDSYKSEVEALITPESFSFPLISLLISGGHTQLVLVKSWGDYEIIGETIDDAVGEAFDKVARMLGMSYPGGPKISHAAEKGELHEEISLPRPMIHSKDYRFSFSGLKTAARYLIEEIKERNDLTEEMIHSIAKEFEHAVTEVLVKKTKNALLEYGAQGLIIAGGVSANRFITENFKNLCNELDIEIYLPERNLCGDNSMMIASAGFLNLKYKKTAPLSADANVEAVSNLKL